MDQESTSGRVTNLDQRLYVKIETIRSKTLTEIYRALHEVCGTLTMDGSTISQWST